VLNSADTAVGKQLVRRLVDEVINRGDMSVLEEIYTEPMARRRTVERALADPRRSQACTAQARISPSCSRPAQLRAVAPVFARGLRLNPDVIDRWADFDARIGIVDRRPDVRRAFDSSLTGER
jgi:hypothetical protein